MASEAMSAYVRFFVQDDVSGETSKVEANAKKTADALDGAGDKAEGKFGGALKKVGAAAAAMGAAAVAGLAKVGKASLDAYADYQQLEGGIQTLFGTKGAENVEKYAEMVGKSVSEVEGEYKSLKAAEELMMNNAAQAYKTAGMSANEYMETATATAAAMVSSLGGDTEEAAKLVNQSVIDMSDNANKMGTNIQDIQNAYNGFAKQNYTMLDNLKLGYGGTQAEMQRLLKDAEAISGVKYDISSYADITKAINVIQTEMGITGTTAMEATETISGSISMMKGAYQNWLVGLADKNADLEKLTTEMVDSISTVIDNVAPRIIQIGKGISQALPMLVPKLLDVGIKLAMTLLEGIIQTIPQLLEALVQAIGSIVEALPGLIGTLVETLATAIPSLLQTLITAVLNVGTTIVEQLPTLLQTLLGAVTTLVTGLLGMLPTLLPTIIQAVVGIITAIATALPTMIDSLIEAVTAIIQAVVDLLPTLIPILLEAAITLFMALVEALPQIVDQLISGATALIYAVIDMLPVLIPALLQASVALFFALVQALPQILPQLLGAIKNLIGQGIKLLPTFLTTLLGAAVNLFMGIVKAIPKVIPEVIKGLKGLLEKLPEKVKEFAGDMGTAAKDMILGMVNGIGDAAQWVIDKLGELCGNALDAVKNFFGIGSPSKEFRAMFKWIPIGGALGIEDEAEVPVKALYDMGEQMDVAAAAIGASATFSGSGDGFTGAVARAVEQVNNWTINTGETDPEKLAKMIAAEQRRNSYALGNM